MSADFRTYIFRKTGSKTLSGTLALFIIDSEDVIYMLETTYKRSVPSSAVPYVRKTDSYHATLTRRGKRILSILLSGWMRENNINKKVKILKL